MANDDVRIWRLPLPDDLEPEGLWCVQFQIPAGDDYVQALSATLGLLTIAKTFERDETHVAARTVSHTWENALYISPMNVNEVCIVTPTPPIPDQAAADDQAAALFITWFQHFVTMFNACAPSSADCAGCVEAAMVELGPYGAGGAVKGVLDRLCRDLNDMTPEQRAEYEDNCIYVPQFDDLRHKIKDNPYDWLNRLSDWLYGWLSHTSDKVLNDLNMAAALLGGGGLGGWVHDHGGGGGGSTFGGDCAWTEILEVTVNDGSFVLSHQGGIAGYGQWHSAVGWHDSLVLNDPIMGFSVRGLSICLPATPFRMTFLGITYDAVLGSNFGEPAPNWGLFSQLDMAGNAALGGGNTEEGTGKTASWTGSVDAVSAGLYIVCGWDSLGFDPEGSVAVTIIEVHGIGFNPWA